MKFMRTALAVAIGATAVVMISGSQQVSALDRRDPFTPWPACSGAMQYCVETLQFTPPGGEAVTYENPASMGSGEPYVNFFDQRMDGGDPSLLPMLGYSLINPFSGGGMEGTNDGLEDGTYRMVVRVGDFDPTVFLSSGFVDEYSVTQGEDGYWTLDATMRPGVFAGPEIPPMGQPNPCNFMTWPVDPCDYAVVGTRRDIHGGVVEMTGSAGDVNFDEREDLRGMWIATNAFTFNFPTVNVDDRSFSATAIGSHYLPSDYGNCAEQGLESEDGLCVNPAHYVTYITYRAIAKLMNMPVEIVKAYITEDAMTTEVDSKAFRNFDVIVGEDGITVDLQIEHFSAPNPKIKLKAVKTLKAGAKAARTSYFNLPGNAKVTEFSIGRQTSKNLCTSVDKGKSVRAASDKRGYCVLTIKYKVGTKPRVLTKKTAIRVVR